MTLKEKIEAEMMVDEPTEEELVRAIRPYVRIGKDSKRLVTTERFDELPPARNVAAYLLGAYARSRLHPSYTRSVPLRRLVLKTGLHEFDIGSLDFADVEGEDVSLDAGSIQSIVDWVGDHE
jgi:hypothetical protein